MKPQYKNVNTLLLAAGLVLFAAITRLLPHPFNFTAIGAMALFSGATFRNKPWAYLLPFTALFLTDLILGFHFSLLPVYACFAFTVWIGTKINSQPKPMQIGVFSILSSVVFFLVTNLPVWYADISLYPISLKGTLTSYTMALPFFKNQILGDLVYNALLFGVYHLFAQSRKVQISVLKK